LPANAQQEKLNKFHIVDSATSKPIITSIAIARARLYTITEKDGVFIIPGDLKTFRDTIIFSAEGYTDLKIPLNRLPGLDTLRLGKLAVNFTGIATKPAGTATTDKDLALITDKLDNYNQQFPAEKVYLHADKPYYNVGDTLWFKSYLSDRVTLTGSKLSGLLYVELYSDAIGMVRRISIPIKNGLGSGQIALISAIFGEGGYTLRAYTNWMQNFGQDYIFSQRLYIGQPSGQSWLVKSNAVINHMADKNQLEATIRLTRPDDLSSPIALKKMDVKLFDEWHYIFNQEIQTGLDGSIKLSQVLNEKSDWRKLRVQITSLEQTETKVLQIPLNIDNSPNVDLQFLPEGGKLVTGLKSTVGFKAIGADGRGAQVSGSIYDAKGSEVVAFAALHNGMGTFEFTPAKGERYIAKITQPFTKNVELPDIYATGTTMHVNNPEQGDNIAITLAGLNQLPADSACYLIGTSRGNIYYSQKINPGKAAIAIAKNLFPSGIAKFTLFKGKTPLNERAVFIDHHDQLNIKIASNKTTYNKRDNVVLDIVVRDKSGAPVKGSFSLAVTDDSQVKADSPGNLSIAANLLLKAELRGYIENPGYYIIRKDNQAWQALDNLMLTQGWTNYEWNKVFAPTRPAMFEVEKDFKVTGKVVGLTNNPLRNQTVWISSQKPVFTTKTTTDINGRYQFKNLPAIDSSFFVLKAENAKGKSMTFGMLSVDKFTAVDMPQTLTPPLLPWYINSDTTQLNYAKRKIEKDREEDLKLAGNVLKEVKINAKKIIRDSFNPYGPGNADISLDEKDIKQLAVANLYELLKQKLPDFKGIEKIPIIKFSTYIVTSKDLTIDGRPVMMNDDELLEDVLSEFTDDRLKGVEIIYSREYTNRLDFKRAGTFANIVITTHDGDGWYRHTTVGAASYRPLPVTRPQQFYSPKYNIASTAIQPDYRTTIFWAPNINTDAAGRARVSFYTSDTGASYTIKIAGVAANGSIGDGSFVIKSKTSLP
jgi:hypothetical protein